MTTVELPLYRRRERELYRRALVGELVAEELPTHLRWRLVAELVLAGLSDQQIAEWTVQTEYTVARIRNGMGLTANRLVVARTGDPKFGPNFGIGEVRTQNCFHSELSRTGESA